MSSSIEYRRYRERVKTKLSLQSRGEQRLPVEKKQGRDHTITQRTERRETTSSVERTKEIRGLRRTRGKLKGANRTPGSAIQQLVAAKEIILPGRRSWSRTRRAQRSRSIATSSSSSSPRPLFVILEIFLKAFLVRQLRQLLPYPEPTAPLRRR